jgi:tetratricopeptide (TPR) repeat protein
VRRCLGSEDTPPPAPVPRRPSRWRTLSLLGIGALLVAGLALWSYLQRPGEPPAAEQVVEDLPEGRQSVAVMEIRNLSNHPDGDWLAGGLTEELRREVAALGRFDVLPGALTRGRQAGELAGEVQILVDGYLQAGADGAEVVLDVLTPDNAGQAIEQRASAPWQEPRALQRLIAANLANIIGSTVAAEEGLVPSTTAWSQYLRYVHQGNFGDIEEQIYWLERTLEIDPQWHFGWAHLARYRMQQYNALGDAEYLRLADAAAGAGAAARIGSWMLPPVRLYGHGEVEQWLPAFAQMASVSGVEVFYPMLAMAFGLNEEVREPLRRLAERQPHQAALQQAIAWNEMLLGDHERARAAADRMLQLSTGDSFQAWLIAGAQAAKAGDLVRANQFLASMRERTAAAPPGSEAWRARDRWQSTLVSAIAAERGDSATVRPVIDALKTDGMYLAAATHLLIHGDEQAAEALLDASAGQPADGRWSLYINRAVMTPAQRRHPVTAEIARRMGFTPQLRLAMCLDMARQPPTLGYRCDPGRYE